MSYNLPLSGLDRDGDVSVTQQLVERFAAAIERGDLAPGAKLPPTRALAADAGINHLTAARVYRKLAEDGYVTAAVGRGTFVRALVPAAADEQGDDWQSYVLPDRQASYQEEILSDAFRLAHEEGMISLATGFPSPRFHPTEELAAIAADMFADEGKAAIAYTDPEGLVELRERIAAGGIERGFADGPDEIVVTSGGQQAIDVAVRAIVERDDVVVVESPTFVGTMVALRSTGARVIGVPVDEHGFDVDALEHVLKRHEVKLCALQPACQNPTGTDLSDERRRRLTELARERNFFVLEDGVYADLRYEGDALPALRRDLGELVRRMEARGGETGGEGDHALLAGHPEGVGENLLLIGGRAVWEHIGLPVVALLVCGGRHEGSHERPPPDRGGHIALLCELAVDARGGQMVDARIHGQGPGRWQLLAGSERALLDRRGEAVRELLGQRDVAVAIEAGQSRLVRHCIAHKQAHTSVTRPVAATCTRRGGPYGRCRSDNRRHEQLARHRAGRR